ncbi:MAG TPA: hypothetical protein VGB67_04060 [Fibrella sp.]|jgi:hypothetical protein
MEANVVLAEDLNIPPAQPGDYYVPEGEEVLPLPGFDKDIAALDTPVDRSKPETPAPGTPPADTPAGDVADDVVFDQPAPINDWKERADKLQMTGVSSEAEFRHELDLRDYVQSEFFRDPALKAANDLYHGGDTITDEVFIKHYLNATKGEFDEEEDIERKLSELIDEDGNPTRKGARIAEHARKQVKDTVEAAVDKLAQEGNEFINERNTFNTTLQTTIKALPTATAENPDLGYTAAEKTELFRYIQNREYDRDAMLLDQNGNPRFKGKEQAEKLLDQALRIHPKFEERRRRVMYEDAKKMGVDEFIKKTYK